MKTKQEIDQKYINQASQLEMEFFDIIDRGKPSQHRILKAGKSIDDFNLRHGDIWRNHEAELIANGFIEAPLPVTPPRDLAIEIDDLKARLKEKGIL